VDLSFLPGVNAALNATAVVLLIAGRRLARAQRFDAHRRVMIAAFAGSSLFLVLYVAHKTSRGFVNTAFQPRSRARRVSRHALHARRARDDSAGAGDRADRARRERPSRESSSSRALRVADLGVRVGDGRADLPAAYKESAPVGPRRRCESGGISRRCGAANVL
jgi:hypothetical protein